LSFRRVTRTGIHPASPLENAPSRNFLLNHRIAGFIQPADQRLLALQRRRGLLRPITALRHKNVATSADRVQSRLLNWRSCIPASEVDVAVFANLPISRKLMTAFAAVVAVIFVCSATVYDRLRVIEWAKDLRTRTANVLDTVQDATDAMLDQETGMRGYLLTADATFLEPYHAGGPAFTAAFRKLKDLTSDNPAQQSRLDELNDLAKKWRSEIAEPRIALAANPDTREDGRSLEQSRAGKAVMDLVRIKLSEVDAVERDLLDKRGAVQERAFRTAYAIAVAGGAISLVIALLMGGLLTRSIAVPITRMTKAMEALAKGDTNIEVPGASRADEIGSMAATVHVFRDSIIERQRAQAELAHVNRVATMGQLSASIAHEVSQPITAAAINADAALGFLDADPPNVEQARQILTQIADDVRRAGTILHRIRAMFKKGLPRKDQFDLNEAILDVIALTQSEVLSHSVSLRTKLAEDLPLIEGERIQLQQVLMNLILNAVQAMTVLDRGAREVQICTTIDPAGSVLVVVRDSGPGLDAASVDRLFQPFYTTKPDGMGMGLAICRSIIEAHGGRLWVTSNEPHGATFQFALPRS
jgi:signal transduction histidine kinase